MTDEQIKKIEQAAERDIESHPYLRKGQAISNLVSVIINQYDPELYKKFREDVTGTDKDPFYKDKNLPAFIEYLKKEIPDK